MKALLLASVLAFGFVGVLRTEESPVSTTFSTDDCPAAVAAAKDRGAATAARDIQAGTLRILYYGKPWSQGKPLVDEATGYRVQILGGCVVTATFQAEVDAYNGAMRGFRAKAQPAAAPK